MGDQVTGLLTMVDRTVNAVAIGSPFCHLGGKSEKAGGKRVS
jgi:hypothetical protein